MSLLEKAWPRGTNVSLVFSGRETYCGGTQGNEEESPSAPSESSKKSTAKDGQTMIFPSDCKEGPATHRRQDLEPVRPVFKGQGMDTRRSTPSSQEIGQLCFSKGMCCCCNHVFPSQTSDNCLQGGIFRGNMVGYESSPPALAVGCSPTNAHTAAPLPELHLK